MIAPPTAFSPVQIRRLALDELKSGSAVVAVRGDGLTAGQRHDVRSQRARRQHQPRYAESGLRRPAISAAAAGAPARRSARIVDTSVAPRKLAIAVA